MIWDPLLDIVQIHDRNKFCLKLFVTLGNKLLHFKRLRLDLANSATNKEIFSVTPTIPCIYLTVQGYVRMYNTNP